MDFGTAVRSCFQRYARFEGRAARPEFWWFALFNLLASVVMGLVDQMLGLELLQPIYSLAVLLPALAVGARRLHDTDRSAWWLLLWLLPVIGTIVLIVFLAQKSDPVPNRFGAAPAGGVPPGA